MAKCLSFHAPYGCRRSGACCKAGWRIPFDAGETVTVLALSVVRGGVEKTRDGAFALHEIETDVVEPHDEGEPPETYPWGV